jgi:branched-chain amino acid transport system substrate-binding protein
MIGGARTMGRREQGGGLTVQSIGKRPAVIASAVGLGMIGLAACGSAGGSASASSALSVVVFQSFTGTDAAFGPPNLAGCVAGANEVNAAGGVLGHKIVCTTVDDKSDPADAVPAATKLLTSTANLVLVLGPPGNSAPTTAPIIGASKIPMVSGTGTPLLDHNTDPYFYRIVPSDSVTGVAMAYWAYHRGCTKAAAVFDTNSSAATVVPALKAEYAKLGGHLVDNLLVVADTPSYRTEAAQVVAAHPQCVFTETDPGTAATFWSEVRQLTGSVPPIYGDQADLFGPYYQAVLPVVGKAFDFTALSQSAPAPSAGYTAFEKYLATASSVVKQPMQYVGAGPTISNADAVIIAALAMTAAHSTSGAAYQPYITRITGNPSNGATVVHTYAEGVKALKEHKKIVYSGAGGPIIFNKYHNAAAQFSALKLDDSTKTVSDLGSIPLNALP